MSCQIPSGWDFVGSSPVSTVRGSEKYCSGIGAVTGSKLSHAGCGSQDWSCWRPANVTVLNPIIYPVSELMGLNPDTMKAIALKTPLLEGVPIVSVTTLVPTSEVKPLISEGVAGKLLEAGFSQQQVLPLTEPNWTQQQVDNLMVESRSLGIIPPRDIPAEILVVTPVEEITPSLIPTGKVTEGQFWGGFTAIGIILVGIMLISTIK